MKSMSPTGLLLTAIMLLSGAIVSASGEGTTAIPRPEHPRPDLQRDNWLTLNGEWQFEIDKAADGEARGLDQMARISPARSSSPSVPRANYQVWAWAIARSSRTSGTAACSRSPRP